MSPTYTYRCQHRHEVYARRSIEDRHREPFGQCPAQAEEDVTIACDYELVMSPTSKPVVKGGTPNHHG